MNRKNDPHTGRFVAGNPGRPTGSKNTRSVQWEELGHQIMEGNAARFNDLLTRLWDSSDLNDQLRGAELFLKVAEYFKPKLQRVQTTPDRSPLIPAIVIKDDIPAIPENWPGPIIRLTKTPPAHVEGERNLQ